MAKIRCKPCISSNTALPNAKCSKNQQCAISLGKEKDEVFEMSMGNKISRFIELRRAYRELQQLSDAGLKDIGLSRGAVKSAVYGK